MTKPICWHCPSKYRIKIRGQLGNSWSEWFDGLTVKSEGAFTKIIGDVLDQSALHGLLVRIRDLGLPLISVSRIESQSELEQQKTNAAKGDLNS